MVVKSIRGNEILKNVLGNVLYISVMIWCGSTQVEFEL